MPGRQALCQAVVVTTAPPARPALPVSSASRGARSLVRRSTGDRVLAGVAGGIGERLGVDPLPLRVAFVVLALAGGAGVVVYALAAALTPVATEPPAPRRAGGDPRHAAAVGCVALGLLLLLRAVGLWFGDGLVWPAAATGAGSVLLWLRSDDRERARLVDRFGRRLPQDAIGTVFATRVSPRRAILGAVLAVIGIAAAVAHAEGLAALRDALVPMVVAVAGLGLLLGPWAMQLVAQLRVEREARVRSQERTEVAAHLHDSVLQTLALIQRADGREEMVALARGQERELRAWLAGTVAGEDTVAAAVDEIAARVERLHHVPVEAVVVGDGPVDEAVRTVLSAASEAATNAARHAGAAKVFVFVELEEHLVTAAVRDEGCGFDPSAVPGDRRGLADSIRGRVLAAGGEVLIDTAPGEGTEVTVRVPR